MLSATQLPRVESLWWQVPDTKQQAPLLQFDVDYMHWVPTSPRAEEPDNSSTPDLWYEDEHNEVAEWHRSLKNTDVPSVVKVLSETK